MDDATREALLALAADLDRLGDLTHRAFRTVQAGQSVPLDDLDQIGRGCAGNAKSLRRLAVEAGPHDDQKKGA